RAAGDHHEVPRLPVPRRRRPPPRLTDALEVSPGDRLAGVLAHVAPRPDGVPRLHGTVLPHAGWLTARPLACTDSLRSAGRCPLLAPPPGCPRHRQPPVPLPCPARPYVGLPMDAGRDSAHLAAARPGGRRPVHPDAVLPGPGVHGRRLPAPGDHPRVPLP